MPAAASSQERKRVIVTGGAGYIGSHVVLELMLTGRYLPVVIDNGHNSKAKAVQKVEEVAADVLGDSNLPRIDLHKVDLTSATQIEDVFKSYEGQGGVWGVVHIAAWKAVGESGELPLQYYQNNVSATISLLDVMSRYNTKHFVYSSSATVYGVPAVIPIPESMPLAPESCYGRTKAMCEMMLKDLAKADPELKACSLRYFNPAGAHPSGKIGEDPQGKPGNLIPLLAAMAVGRYLQPGFKVFGNDYPTVDGTCVRDYLHIVDLAQGHVLALDGIASGKVFTFAAPLPPSASPTLKQNGSAPHPPASTLAPFEGNYKAYNLGRGQAYSVLQIVAAMEKATGVKYEYEVVGRRDGDVPDLTADPRLAQEELGFVASRGLEEACTDLWRWQTNSPNGYDTVQKTAP